MPGYRALHEAAAVLDISARGRIRVTGEDRLRLIHAMCSNDVERLGPGQGAYAFFLDAHGHILTDCRIYVADDHLLLDCEPERCSALIDHLSRFIIMDDVTLEDVTASLAAAAIEGPDCEAIVRRAFGDCLPGAAPYAHAESGGVRLVRGSITARPGLWALAEAGERQDIVEKLAAAGAVEAKPEDFRITRVEDAVPRCGEDFPESALPQETQLMHAISFDKGCYLGQEIVERVRSRGSVNKLLMGLEVDGSQAPDEGAPVVFEGKQVGRMTSAVYSPRLGRVVGFSLLSRRSAAPGTTLEVAGRPARVRNLAAQPA